MQDLRMQFLEIPRPETKHRAGLVGAVFPLKYQPFSRARVRVVRSQTSVGP